MNKALFVFRQWAIRLVYTNQLCMNVYKAISTIRVKRRIFSRVVKSSLPKRSDGQGSEADDRMEANIGRGEFARYQREFSKIQGWFLSEAQVLWDCLLCFQRENALGGNMLEIGVWKGKSAACSTLHARQDEVCVFIDRMILPEFKATINSIRTSNNLFVQKPSSELPNTLPISELGSTFRWIHIDGEHSGESVANDLSVAMSLLAEHGVICVDDFPSCAYPQINFAVTQFLAQHPTLTMFACGHNKGYICHQQSAQQYLSFFKNALHREMVARGADVTIWKSGRPSDPNCFGVTDRVESYDYRGPDWNPRKIEI